MVIVILNCFCIFGSVKQKFLLLSTRLNSVLIEVIACVCSRVKSFGLTSELIFYGEAFSLVDSRFAIRFMFVDWSIGRNFRSVFKSCRYLMFNLKNSERILITYSSSCVPRLLLLRWNFYLGGPIILKSFLPCVLMKFRSVSIYQTISLIVLCIVGMFGYLQLMDLKLGDRYRDVLPYRISKSKFSLFPKLLRVFPVLRLNSSSGYHSHMGWRMRLVGLCRHFVFAIKLYQVRFDLRRLTLYYLGL